MILRLPTPRLLPVTIGVLTFVLGAKFVDLARLGIEGQPVPLISASWAAAADATAGKAGAKPAERDPDKKSAAVVAPKPPDKPSVQDSAPPPVTDGERAVLLELRDRRKELETREASLTARESVLAAAEMKLSSRIDELRALQQKLETLEADRKQQENTAWQGLVKVYESMKPRDAAAIFNDLGMPVLLAVIDRMKEAKAGSILAAMAPDKAREVTTQLAAMRSRGSSVVTGGKPAISAEPSKTPGSGT